MKAIMVAANWCPHCERAKQTLHGIIEKGYLEVVDVQDAIDKYGEIDCMKSEMGYSIPTIVLVDDNEKVKRCLPTNSNAIVRALIHG